MTATLNGTFNSAPDTPSPIYPDRLIRPLPRRSLRSRLSIDAADTIHYPPTPPASQIFYGVGDTEEVAPHGKAYARQKAIDRHELTPEADAHDFETAIELESGDEDGPVVVRRSAGFRRSMSAGASPRHRGFTAPAMSEENSQREKARDGREDTQRSIGPDGYDAFENTNNKKKRKIPTPGNLVPHHTALSPEFANMGIFSSKPSTPPPASEDLTTGTYYGDGNPASPLTSGISGSGRGRLGRGSTRMSTGRNPLSANAQNAWMTSTARAPSRRDVLMSSPGSSGESSDQGIISTAIAKAATLVTPSHGPGNGSLLDQESSHPTKTQFTFTCESDSSKGMALQRDPYPGSYRSHASPLAPTTQLPRGYPGSRDPTSPTGSGPAHQQVNHGARLPPTQGGQAQVGRKKKRSPGSVYGTAARQRKIQQQYANIHHPPRLEDIWICEFCEYESIFGHPPEALIRQYEIKDRRERKRLAEKKRLLEKAKMKGRKTKKAPKNSKNAAYHQDYQPGYDRASVDHSSAAGSGHLDDEYLGHDYYDDDQGSIPGQDPVSPAELRPPLPAVHSTAHKPAVASPPSGVVKAGEDPGSH
ncbi:Uncharacterized protein PECH_003610 [Penicillium ucsense]|uniref:Uncharacterized protein n=1 Tax=Penicillium ucsense TaxID=2839758 RepID=A0A8J8VWC0_9EURO|nr:Uncharacterized protein PECM_003103 [Penicillium ucsense]KAF7729298.1 Uncharacterized protein PECH_003610 [Penicillium ucsense]